MSIVIKSKTNTYILDQNPIGKGSFGVVYRSGEYAVKCIDLSLLKERYLKSALQREINILKKIKHPNIVSLKDVIQQSSKVYLVMQYCQTDLLKYSKTHKLTQLKAKKILIQIIKGFSYLVQNDIIHRDLKPANVLVNGRGQFKIADFGFAKCVDNYEDTLLKSCVGTPLYMAPQILKRLRYTTKCDIWSVGFMYYELITGKVPWEGKSEIQLYNNIKNKKLVIPNFISEWSAEILKKMLVFDEKDRISWEDLIKYVLQGENDPKKLPFSFDNNLPKQIKQLDYQKNFEDKNLNSNVLMVKQMDLIELFYLELLEFFDEQTVEKIVHNRNYRCSVNEIGIIKKALNNFVPDFQTFISNNFLLEL